MIWIAVLCVLVAIVGAGILFTTSDDDTKGGAMIAAFGAIVLSLIFFLISCITIVDSGHVGVPVLFGSVQEGTIDSGIHLVNPFYSIEQMSVRTENYWMSHQHDEGGKKGDDSVSVRSANGLQMPIDISVPYRLVPESSPWVYRNLGKDYVSKILRPALSTATRRAASHYTAEELYSTKRDEFSEKIRVLLDEELQKLLQESYKGKNPPEAVLVTSQVLVGHVGIPEMVKNAIESKLKADQEQQAMEFTILKEKKEAERKKVEAEGIRNFQDIVTKGIDEKLLRWKAIDATLHLATSPNSKVIVIGSGRDGLPVLLNGSGDIQIQADPNKK